MDIHPSARIALSAYIDRTWPKGVHIGQDVLLCEEVIVLTHDITRGLFLDTWIGSNSILLPRSIIMPGIKVGEGCLVMPGAIVTKDLPANSVATGNPVTISAR